MSYIGKTPTVGNFIKLDAITTSATNSYTLQHNLVNFSPESANHMMVSLNGVIQAPNTSYSVSGSTITFLPSSGTLSSSDSIDFIMVYGNILDLGVASSVTDSSITKGKLNLISDSSSAGLTVKGDGSSENGTIQLNCSQNSHGIKLSSPAHSSGQSYELIFPTGNVTADKVLKVASVSGSGATGIGQLSFGDASSDFVLLATADANNSATKISFDGYFSSTYKNYKLIGSNITIASGQSALRVRFRRSNTEITASEYYAVGVRYYIVDGSITAVGHTGSSSALLVNENTARTDGFNTSFTLDLYDPLGTNNYKNATFITHGFDASTNDNRHHFETGALGLTDSTNALSGIVIDQAGGVNIVRGNFKLYGIK